MQRPGRFRLLRKGFERAGWEAEGMKLIEIGCAAGDASAEMADAGFDVTGVDLSEELVERAKELHKTGDSLRFVCADAADLPFDDGSFDGLYCEAAFSPLPDKEKVLREYARVLRPGAKVLVNDFVIKKEDPGNSREQVVHIPCFAGVQTHACYEELFKEAGFEPVEYHDEYFELLGLTNWVCKFYDLEADEVGGFLSGYFHSGASSGDGCETATDIRQESFFKKTELSYCRMIFQKKG